MSEMETAAAEMRSRTAAPSFAIRPITADEYHRMLDAGILYEREPVELLEGQLIAMPPEGPVHSSVVSRLTDALVRRFSGRAIVRPGNALALSRVSEPQPDFALVRPRDDWYSGALPGPRDVLLLIEVSWSTLRYDRRDKLRAYARAGIAEFWIVDLVNRRVEVHAEPHELGYASSRSARPGESLAPRAFPEDAIAVESILP